MRAAVDAVGRVGQLDDRPALPGVASASEDRYAASASSRVRPSPGTAQELGGPPVAEGDRAGLVEQQRRHVAGGLDGAARHGEDVALDEPVHAGDADGGQQRADRGRDEADEQGDEDDDRLRRPE